MKKKLARNFLILMLILTLPSTAYGYGTIRIDGFYDDWEDKPHTEVYNGKNPPGSKINYVSLSKDETNAYVHIIYAQKNNQSIVNMRINLETNLGESNYYIVPDDDFSHDRGNDKDKNGDKDGKENSGDDSGDNDPGIDREGEAQGDSGDDLNDNASQTPDTDDSDNGGHEPASQPDTGNDEIKDNSNADSGPKDGDKGNQDKEKDKDKEKNKESGKEEDGLLLGMERVVYFAAQESAGTPETVSELDSGNEETPVVNANNSTEEVPAADEALQNNVNMPVTTENQRTNEEAADNTRNNETEEVNVPEQNSGTEEADSDLEQNSETETGDSNLNDVQDQPEENDFDSDQDHETDSPNQDTETDPFDLLDPNLPMDPDDLLKPEEPGNDTVNNHQDGPLKPEEDGSNNPWNPIEKDSPADPNQEEKLDEEPDDEEIWDPFDPESGWKNRPDYYDTWSFTVYQGRSPVGAGYFTRKEGEAEEAEFYIPLDTISDQSDGITEMSMVIKKLGKQSVICVGASSAPYFGAAIGAGIAMLSVISYTHKKKRPLLSKGK